MLLLVAALLLCSLVVLPAGAAGGKLEKTSGETRYRYADGTYAKKTWVKIGSNYYYFLKSGKMAVNRMITTNKKTYYVDARGARVKSMWVKKSGKRYYFNRSGVRVQNQWMKLSGKYYYFGANGVLAENRRVGDFYVGKDGARLVSCIKNGYWLNAYGKKTVKVFYGDYIFVGDSRMVGMQDSVASSDTLYIAKINQGYKWLEETAGLTLRYHLRANPKVKVVLALGVNDLGNVQRYIAYYKELMKEFPDTKFYVLSANPVDEVKGAQYGYKVRMKEISNFNNKMYVAFRTPTFVNSCRYLNEKGFESFDGVHYTASTYRKLYKFIVNKISA